MAKKENRNGEKKDVNPKKRRKKLWPGRVEKTPQMQSKSFPPADAKKCPLKTFLLHLAWHDIMAYFFSILLRMLSA